MRMILLSFAILVVIGCTQKSATGPDPDTTTAKLVTVDIDTGEYVRDARVYADVLVGLAPCKIRVPAGDTLTAFFYATVSNFAYNFVSLGDTTSIEWREYQAGLRGYSVSGTRQNCWQKFVPISDTTWMLGNQD